MFIAMQYRRAEFSETSAGLMDEARRLFRYAPGETRATGRLIGPAFEDMAANHAVFQAYKNGSATCDWHADDYDQIIVSLGATRTMGVCIDGDEQHFPISDGDVLLLPAGVPHAVLADPDITDERISLVFRFLKGQS